MKRNVEAINIIENAGKYLVKSRDLYGYAAVLTATEAAHSPNPDIHTLAVLSVLMARITGAKDNGWVSDICTTLGIPQ